MPIRPIDLQTLLMQLGQVGREQSAAKEGAVLQQAMQSAVAQRKHIEATQGVHKAEDPEGGASEIEDRHGKGTGLGTGGGSEGEARNGEEKSSDEIVRDPSLGKNVDISG
jgi:hypothetical protein